MAAIRLLMESPLEKVVWFAPFDCPRILAAGVQIGGHVFDGMVAWHVLHSDVPKGLGFVATFTCPWYPRWKHLSTTQPAFYNATDADIEAQSMTVIEAELMKAGLWSVYQEDVLDLDPILAEMSRAGLPIDTEVRERHAKTLQTECQEIIAKLEDAIPLAVRRIERVYKKPPADLTGLCSRVGLQVVAVCPVCRMCRPPKRHFRIFKRKANPCGGHQATTETQTRLEYYRLAPLKISSALLIRYQEACGRPVPTRWDKKTHAHRPTMNAQAIQQMQRQFPDDPVYPLVLTYRELEKLAGTYIGRPA